MGKPVSHPEFRHTCPACNRPVRPGYKFCEVCGTRIPELSTCSKCGTQFVHPEKFCDLCGAPVIPAETPEPDTDEVPEPDDDEMTEPDTDEVLEPEDEEMREPYTDEILEPDDEEMTEPAEEETPEHDEDEIPEPDTDELLEQFGGEYGEDETLESYRKPKPTLPLHHEAKKPARAPALRGRGSSETVDDALFLLDEGPAPAKPQKNKLRIIGGGIVLITILAAVFFLGLPMIRGNGGFSTHSNLTAAEISPLPQPIIARTTTPVPPSRAFVPLPTQQVPTDQKFAFHVQKNPVTSKILVIFTGSSGEGGISSADIKVTHTDGSVATGMILPLKGVNEISLDGSKGTDRVEIIAALSSGKTYRVYDALVSF